MVHYKTGREDYWTWSMYDLTFVKNKYPKSHMQLTLEDEIAEDFYFQLDTILKWLNFYEYMLLL